MPLQRLGPCEDIARMALVLASDRAAYVSGVVLPVDGGLSLTGPRDFSAAADESAARAQGPRWAAVRTRSLQVPFLRPRLGPLNARAQVTGGGQTLCFCQATVHDDQGQPVARALATLSLPSTQEKTP